MPVVPIVFTSGRSGMRAPGRPTASFWGTGVTQNPEAWRGRRYQQQGSLGTHSYRESPSPAYRDHFSIIKELAI